MNIDINLLCFDRNFDHPLINLATFVPRKKSKKPQIFPQKQFCLLKKAFDMYLLSGLSILVCQNSGVFLENWYLTVVPFKN